MDNTNKIASFKKANKVRKQRIAESFGFDTPEKYLVSLINLTKSNKKVVRKANPYIKPIIHIVHIVDRSGSMAGGKLRAAIAGVNSEITELKKDDSVDYFITLVDFDNTIKTKINKIAIANVDNYNTFAGGMTALNEAVGETLEKLIKEANGKDKYLVKIFTDGGENASKGKWHIFSNGNEEVERVKRIAEEKGFTITFVGTENDVQTAIKNYNIDFTNTLVHDNTSRGVEMAFMSSATATQNYSSKVVKGEDVLKGFYNKQIGKL